MPFVECCHDGVRTHGQDACGVAHPTSMHRHVAARLLHRGRLTSITIVQEESATGPALLAAAVPWLPLTGLAMADTIRAVTVGTVEGLENHDALDHVGVLGFRDTHRE